jgi:hypothetical protein
MYRRTAFYFVGRFALPGLWDGRRWSTFTQHAFPAEVNGLAPNELSLRATPAYLGILLPTGFIGLLLAAALAAEMSNRQRISSYLGDRDLQRLADALHQKASFRKGAVAHYPGLVLGIGLFCWCMVCGTKCQGTRGITWR